MQEPGLIVKLCTEEAKCRELPITAALLCSGSTIAHGDMPKLAVCGVYVEHRIRSSTRSSNDKVKEENRRNSTIDHEKLYFQIGIEKLED